MTRGLGIVVLLAGVLPGCSALRAINPFDSPPTFSNTQFVGYVAIDPISLPAAAFGAKAKERGDHDPNLDALSNNAARIAMQEITQDGEAKYVASSLSYKGNYYKATID